MTNHRFTKNDSSVMTSGLQSHGLTIIFDDSNEKKTECKPQFERTSLSPGEETKL